jgi:hypothetical protein
LFLRISLTSEIRFTLGILFPAGPFPYYIKNRIPCARKVC